MSKLWGGRFESDPDELVVALGDSVRFDARLALCDIRGSEAHARMLGRQGILDEQETQRILEGLEAVRDDVEAGRIEWDPKLEDVHTNIEHALVQRIGDSGKRLHTGRSRNDQIALDTRLWTREQIDGICELLRALQAALIDAAEDNQDVILPGCTHLQHAQPVLLAHHLLAYVEMFERDRERFRDLRGRVNRLPLGAAALAGTTYPIDPQQVADELGFEALCANSMDAVSDRDYVIEFCSAASLTMMHLSRYCEELILWSTPEYGYISISDTFTTGSSIMPQKKNPDVAELIRGKTGRVYGDLTSLLTMMKGLPLAYNRDMQEDKEPLFDAADTVQLCLPAAAGMSRAITFHGDRMAETASEGFLEATELADYLVTKGAPFREAHGIIGQIVLHLTRAKRKLPDLSLEELREFSDKFDDDALALLDLKVAVARRDHPGGTAHTRVAEALQNARRRLNGK